MWEKTGKQTFIESTSLNQLVLFPCNMYMYMYFKLLEYKHSLRWTIDMPL